MTWLYVCAGLLLAFGLWWVATINRFARLRNLTSEAWSGVDVALKRRHDLIPNLVQVVERYAAHEKDVLQRILEVRSAVSKPTDVRSLGEGETLLSGLIGSVIARSEAYPELKSNSHFLELQKELASTEDRIAAARRFYNGNARDYRIALQSFPACLIAGKRTPPEFLKIEFSERLHPLPT